LPSSKRVVAVYNITGLPAWLTVSTAATMTMNSPDSLLQLHRIATASSDKVATAELMREVGLKCISFNSIRKFSWPDNCSTEVARRVLNSQSDK
jgi:hypothetical protein